VLKLPPEWIIQVPFEIEPVVRVLWWFGLVPILSGVGHILAGLLIRQGSIEQAHSLADESGVIHQQVDPPGSSTIWSEQGAQHHSVTERTTNLLHVQETGASTGSGRE
jgi:hypothetical protein